MTRPRFTLSTAMLVVANLAPLVGVLWFRWDAAIVILIYWTENLITGFYNVLRMAFLRVDNPARHLSKLFAIPFFCLHFGGFCAVHGAILMALFREENAWESPSMGGGWPGPLIFLQLLYSVIVGFWRSRPDGAGWIVACLMVSHGVSFVHNYLLKGEYASQTIGQLMARPYKRIVLLHVAILAGAAPILMLGSPLPLLVILILMKICLDIWLHVRSHRTGPAAEQVDPVPA